MRDSFQLILLARDQVAVRCAQPERGAWICGPFGPLAAMAIENPRRFPVETVETAGARAHGGRRRRRLWGERPVIDNASVRALGAVDIGKVRRLPRLLAHSLHVACTKANQSERNQNRLHPSMVRPSSDGARLRGCPGAMGIDKRPEVTLSITMSPAYGAMIPTDDPQNTQEQP